MTSLVFVQGVDEQRRQERLEQLDTAESLRQEERNRRRAEQSSKEDPSENIASVIEDWKQGRGAFEQRLAALADHAPAADEAGRAALKTEFAAVTALLFRLESLLANASYFLPAFEIRSLGGEVAALRARLDGVRAELLPRRKFQFSQANIVVRVEDPLLQGLTTRERLASGGQAGPRLQADSTAGGDSRYVDSSTTISGLRDQTIIKTAQELRGADWMLDDLERCRIFFHGPIQALYLHRLKDCHVQAGPVGGATFGEHVDRCTVFVASHQVRLHHTTDSQMYLAVGSDPIIEFSYGVGFAPLQGLPYDEFAAALGDARIQQGSALWAQVQDFQFPGHKTSPNWRVIPENERLRPEEPGAPCAVSVEYNS